MFRGEGAAGGLRVGLILLVALGVVGSGLALAYERHWQGPWQLAPWITLGILVVATAALMVRPTGAMAWLARTVAVLAIASSAIGVWQHIDANYHVGAAGHDSHDHSHGDESDESGPSMGDVMSGAAGHAPIPAALAVAPAGLALGLATIGLGGRRRPPQG